jgi:RNase P subunit RPR2
MVHWQEEKSRPQRQRREKPKMHPEDLQERWQAQGEEIFAAVAQWRAPHPHATLAEIEQAADEQIHRLRAHMLEQAAQASAAAESEASQGLVCEQCGRPLQARGRAKRRWQTQGGQQVEVERAYVSCPQCGGGFFPPDKELQVSDGHLLPHAQETLVSLSSELPFGRVVKQLKRTLGVVLPVSTVRR